MSENRLFQFFVEIKVAQVSILAHDKIRWVTVGKYVRGLYYEKLPSPSIFLPTFSVFVLDQLSQRRKMRLEQAYLLN